MSAEGVFWDFTYVCQGCREVVRVVMGINLHKCKPTGVNDGTGSTSFPPSGADDAPDESKGAATTAPDRVRSAPADRRRRGSGL